MFEKEYREQSVSARAELRAVLNLLRDQESVEGWCRLNGFDRLSGRYRDLGKLLFKADRVQHRPLGFLGPDAQTFTLLSWATERNWKFYPPDIRETALDRMKAVLQNPTRAHEFDF